MSFEIIMHGDEPDADPPAERRPPWLSGLVSAESLAVGALLAALLAAWLLQSEVSIGTFPLLFGSGDVFADFHGWLVRPRLITGGAGLLLGLAALARVTAESPRWARPVAGGAALLSVIVVGAVLVNWLTLPDVPAEPGF